MKRVIIYHDNCPDGFTAAWACWEKFGDTDTEYWPLAASGKSQLPEIDGRDIVFVDCAMYRDTLLDINDRAASLLVLDHHKTWKEELAGLDFCVFDMHRSGAGLAWDHFHPDEERPWLVNYVEGRDLWTWPHSHNEEVCDGIDLYPRDFHVYSDLAYGDDHDKTSEDFFNEALTNGRAIVQYKRIQVERACSKARMVTIGGYEVPSVNSCLFQSEIGNTLMNMSPNPPFAAIWFRRKDGAFKYSLRSKDAKVDVSEIAKRFGGGGHRNAAAFSTDYEVDETET